MARCESRLRKFLLQSGCKFRPASAFLRHRKLSMRQEFQPEKSFAGVRWNGACVADICRAASPTIAHHVESPCLCKEAVAEMVLTVIVRCGGGGKPWPKDSGVVCTELGLVLHLAPAGAPVQLNVIRFSNVGKVATITS